MNSVARLPLAFAVVGLLAACAGALGESSSASPTTTLSISSETSAPTGPPSVAPRPSESVTVAPGGADASSAAAGDATVEIVGFAFAPAELRIGAGSEVTFINLDDFSHTATAGTADQPMPGLFDSGRLPQGDSFSFAFADAGKYVYYCAVHPAMEASITVED